MQFRVASGALVAAGCFLVVAYAGATMPSVTPPSFPAVHGHRGASGVAPENTLVAFRRAIQMGADALEMDLQLTKDGIVVILHDETLERTTDRPGRLADLTLDEVKRADAGVPKAGAFAGERIPTLAEVIRLVQAESGRRVRLNLELKYHLDRRLAPAPDLERHAIAVLREHDFVSQVLIQSFHHAVLPRVKALEPRIPTGTLVNSREYPSDPVALVRRHGADYFAPEFRAVREADVAALHAAGIPVVTWTVNETADMQRLLAFGVGRLPGDAIISDHPDRLAALRGAGGR